MGWLIFILMCVIFLVAIMLSRPNNTPLKPHENYEPTKFFIETILIDGAKLREHNEKVGAILGKVAASNNEGIAYEEIGNIDGAILAYEQNVASGYPAKHSYIRLMKIYRRRRDYQNELRIIERYLEVFMA